MKKNVTQEFIVTGVAGATGLFIMAMNWSEFKAVMSEHPSVRIFALGLMLLFMAAGNLSTGLKKRSWLRQMEKLSESIDPSS